MIRRLYTLVFVRDVQNKNILLGYKKRGFGMHKWNGLGGKVEPNESIEQGAIREAKEEAGLDLLSLKNVAIIDFQFEHKMSETLECHVFCADSFTGEIQETEEISPKWFNYDDIPYDKMWKDDRIWLPKMLDDKTFKAYFLFKEDQETIVHYHIEEVESLKE